MWYLLLKDSVHSWIESSGEVTRIDLKGNVISNQNFSFNKQLKYFLKWQLKHTWTYNWYWQIFSSWPAHGCLKNGLFPNIKLVFCFFPHWNGEFIGPWSAKIGLIGSNWYPGPVRQFTLNSSKSRERVLIILQNIVLSRDSSWQLILQKLNRD